MPVRYKTVARIDPADKTKAPKYYAQLVPGQDVDLEELAERISKFSSYNYGTTLGFLGTLVEVLEMELKNGRAVRLGDLGTVYLTLSSNAKDHPEEMKDKDITDAKVKLRPSSRFKKLHRQLTYAKEPVKK